MAQPAAPPPPPPFGLFGQLVLGPPGSGKTTYCNGVAHYLSLAGRRCAVVNLDPANDALPYECAVDVADLVSLAQVQRQHGLGPNGGLLFCFAQLAANTDWLGARLAPLLAAGTYLLFDCPGQVELFNVHDSLAAVLHYLTRTLNIRLAAVHLVDSHLVCDASKFLAALLLSLTTMLHLGLPHVNVLSKLDLVATHGAPPFSLDFYTAGGDPEYLARAIEEQAAAGAPGWGLLGRHAKLTRGLCSLVADYGLVSFATLDVQSEGSVRALLAVVDRANGAVFLRAQRAAAPRGDAAPPTLVRPAPPAWLGDAAADVEERLWGRDGGDGDDEG